MNRPAGTASLTNISLHPRSMDHCACEAFTISYSPSATRSITGAIWSPRIMKFTKYTTSWPKMMANWFHETRVPRMLLGAISAMYIGHMAEASPTPIPPSTLYRLKATRSGKEGCP